MKKLITALLLLVPFYATIAQSNFSALDSLLSQYDKPGAPGVSMRIIKDGKIIYNKHAGYADIKDNKHLSDKSVFYLASVSKQFTGACIVMLEQQGKLALSDKLSKYFHDFPEYAQKITIKDLLNHTAGIRDILTLASLKGENVNDYTNEQIKKLLALQELDFEPGSECSYSNSGYWLLAQIAEKASGMPIEDYARANIFSPLKMTNTKYVFKGDNKDENCVIGYADKDDIYTPTDVDARAIIGAGVYSTLDDLQLWLKEMQDKKLLGKTFWNKMLNKDVYEEEGSVYSKGLGINDRDGHKEISHGGYNDGFHTHVAYYPEDRLSIITLSNNDEADTELLNTIAANTVFGFPYKDYIDAYASGSKETGVNSNPLLNQYDGLYNDNGYLYRVTNDNGTLAVLQLFNDKRYEIESVSGDTFKKGNVSFSFEDIKDGKAQKLIVEGETTDTAVRRDIVSGEINKCIGAFYSSALDTEYVFFEEEGNLKCRIGANKIFNADYAIYKVILDFGIIKLDFGENKSVTGFSLNHPRAKNIKFVKKT